jgi:hypothetical protein
MGDCLPGGPSVVVVLERPLPPGNSLEKKLVDLELEVLLEGDGNGKGCCV